MRTRLNKALVDTPAAEYSNSQVDLVADDDVTMIATVMDRRGVVLEVVTGPFTTLAPRGDLVGWEITTDPGVVTIFQQAGCGCGGTAVSPKDFM